MKNLKESREYFKPRLQLELTNLRDVFDQEFKDVLTEIDYKSISDKGILSDLIDEIVGQPTAM